MKRQRENQRDSESPRNRAGSENQEEENEVESVREEWGRQRQLRGGGR